MIENEFNLCPHRRPPASGGQGLDVEASVLALASAVLGIGVVLRPGRGPRNPEINCLFFSGPTLRKDSNPQVSAEKAAG